VLVKARRVTSIREAFTRYLGERGRVAVPSIGLPAAEAIALLQGAGGVAAWAHPAYDCTRERLLHLRSVGLQGVEAVYPSCRHARSRELRAWAAELGLVITGGSDCHGPGQHHHAIGASGITLEELDRIRRLSRGVE
jgi:predicted metal-dependent phosphoesterase TrpH